jgi:hypothetical protein
LARSFASPSTGEALGALSAGIARSGKPVAVVAGGGAGVGSEPAYGSQAAASSSSSSYQSPHAIAQENIRERHENAATDQEFAEFERSNHPFNSMQDAWASHTKIQASGVFENGVNGYDGSQDYYDHWQGPEADGAEVLDLLSDPNFVAISDVYDVEEQTPESAAALFSEPFSPEEKKIANKIRATLPPPPTHTGVASSNPRNLVPDPSMFGFEPSLSSNHELVTAEQAALNEWKDVLNGYTDEVWGDHLEVVQQLKQEIQEAASGQGRLDTKAIERLRMVLGHVSEQKLVDLKQFEHLTSMVNSIPAVSTTKAAPTQEIPMLEAFIANSALPSEHSKAPTQSKAEEFSCPWLSCHEKFNNLTALKEHTTNSHAMYPCAHSNCQESFLTRNDWKKHIRMAHPDMQGMVGGVDEEWNNVWETGQRRDSS